MFVGATVIVGPISAAFTVIVTGLEVVVLELLSVTFNSKDHAPTVVRVPVEVIAGDEQGEELPRLVKLVAPGASWSH